MSLSDEINSATLLPSSDGAGKHVLIFFIPGNPGLVEYYRHFLDIIRKQLNSQASQPNSSNQNTQYHFHGASLAGFDINPSSRQTPSTAHELPLSLDAQVEDVYARLEATVARFRATNNIKGDLPVVLMGHSIGAYMVLQTVAKWRELSQRGPTDMKILSGICLFPTICEMALSPTGRQVGPLTQIPALALIVHTIAKLLFTFAPLALVTWFVQLITRMPPTGANITAQFLKSKHGVHQALHMAKDELAQLTHDRWSDDFWGAATTAIDSATLAAPASKAIASEENGISKPTHTQLYFYWGSDDHWIAQETRDKIIATRARVEGRVGDERKPVMEVDGNGVGHAFCLSEEGNRVVGEKCAGWIGGL